MPKERTALLDQLSQQLAQEATFLRQFYDVLQEEHNTLSERKLDVLEEVVKHKQAILEEFQESVANRMETLYQLGLDKSESDSAQLQHFMEQCGNGEPAIAESWEQLQQLLSTCKEQNTANGAILQISNNGVQMALSILNGRTDKAELYDAKGNTRHGDGSDSTLAKA